MFAEIMRISDRARRKRRLIVCGESWAAPLAGRRAPESGVRTCESRPRTEESRATRFPRTALRWSVSGAPSVVLVMEPTEDRSRSNVLGWNTPHGQQPSRADRWLHTKAAMGSTVIVTDIFLQHTIGVDVVDDNDVVEAIAA